MVPHPLSPTLWGGKQWEVDLCEPKASMVYIVPGQLDQHSTMTLTQEIYRMAYVSRPQMTHAYPEI